MMLPITMELLWKNLPDQRIQCIVASSLGVFHFSVALLLWAIGTRNLGFDQPYLLAHASPAVVLWTVFFMALALAAKRHRYAPILALLGMSGALIAFWYDLHHQRYQLQVWDAPQWRFIYLTWWYYQ